MSLGPQGYLPLFSVINPCYVSGKTSANLIRMCLFDQARLPSPRARYVIADINRQSSIAASCAECLPPQNVFFDIDGPQRQALHQCIEFRNTSLVISSAPHANPEMQAVRRISCLSNWPTGKCPLCTVSVTSLSNMKKTQNTDARSMTHYLLTNLTISRRS